MPQTIPSQVGEEELEGREGAERIWALTGRLRANMSGPPGAALLRTESAALARLIYNSAFCPGGRMGPSPNLAWSSPDCQPLGELPSGKGQHGEGLLRSLAERTPFNAASPQHKPELGDGSSLPILHPEYPGEAPGQMAQDLRWPQRSERNAWREFVHHPTSSLSYDYSLSPPNDVSGFKSKGWRSPAPSSCLSRPSSIQTRSSRDIRPD